MDWWETIMFAAGFCVGAFLMMIACMRLIRSYQDKLESVRKKNIKYREIIMALDNELQIRTNSNSTVKVVHEIPKGTIAAVKFAMIKSHPDNGGNQEDFVLYRNVYNKLTGGKNGIGH